MSMVSTPGFRPISVPVRFGNENEKSQKSNGDHVKEKTASHAATSASSVESDERVEGESAKSKHEADDHPVTKFFNQILGVASDFFQKIADFFQDLARQFKSIDLDKREDSSSDKASRRANGAAHTQESASEEPSEKAEKFSRKAAEGAA